jgi:hypothetical protein
MMRKGWADQVSLGGKGQQIKKADIRSDQ